MDLRSIWLLDYGQGFPTFETTAVTIHIRGIKTKTTLRYSGDIGIVLLFFAKFTLRISNK